MATGWLGVIPPPPGVEENILNPTSQIHSNIALHTICLGLATASVVIRIYTRIFITKASVGADDCLSILSLALSLTFSGLLIKSYEWGIGRHMWDVPPIWLPTALKYFTIAQYIFQVLSCTIKLTFLVLFHRIFWAQQKVRYTIYFGFVFVLSTNLGLLFATIFSCTPVAQAWNQMLGGHCWNPKILPWLSGGLNLLTDLFVLILPMGPLWRLNMVRDRKAKLIAVFSLGGFACIASLARLAQTPILSSSLDATWNISKIAVWAVIEANVGIICASSSLLPAFVDRHCPKVIRKSLSNIWSYTVSRTSSSSDRGSKPASNQRNSAEPKSSAWAQQHFVELRDNDRSTVGTKGSTKSSIPGDQRV